MKDNGKVYTHDLLNHRFALVLPPASPELLWSCPHRAKGALVWFSGDSRKKTGSPCNFSKSVPAVSTSLYTLIIGVQVDNLPPGLTGKEIFDFFDPFGDLLEITAVGPSRLLR